MSENVENCRRWSENVGNNVGKCRNCRKMSEPGLGGDLVIDNIFTNQINPDMLSGNLTVGISDHLISFFIIPNDNQNHLPKKHNLYTRKTKDFDRTNFILDYLDIDWDNILKANEKM